MALDDALVIALVQGAVLLGVVAEVLGVVDAQTEILARVDTGNRRVAACRRYKRLHSVCLHPCQVLTLLVARGGLVWFQGGSELLA